MKADQTSPKDQKIVIGMSGRTDACVAAFLLKKQGFQVIGLGVSFATPDSKIAQVFSGGHWFIPAISPVKKFCDMLAIPFYAVDCEEEFEQSVLEGLFAESLSGRILRPELLVNQILFRTLYEKMQKLDANFLATGHFAKVRKNHKNQEYFLHRGNEIASDQAPSLVYVDQKILAHTLFPLSELRKEESQKIAQNFQLSIPFLEKGPEESGSISQEARQ